MTDLYIIRHCETMGNLNKTFQGVTDCEISACGATQLEYLADRFKNIKIDTIYSSPLKRAIKTAEAVNKYKGLEIKIHNKLIEMDGGDMEGMCWADFPITRPELERVWNEEPYNFKAEGGESMASVYKRCWEAVLEILSENKNKTIAITSHGCTIRNIMCHALGKSIEELNSVSWADNTGVFHLRFSDDLNKLPEILLYNDTNHLPGEFLPAENKIGSYAKED